MAKQLVAKRYAGLGELFGSSRDEGILPFVPQVLTHLYIKLDFKPKYENATTAEDARGFFKSVSRAAIAAHRLASGYGGGLLELQGSVLHVALPHSSGLNEDVQFSNHLTFLGNLHATYKAVFHDTSLRVEGWRVAVDTGKTLVVVRDDVHRDRSWVSLGMAANRPAKYLYAQLQVEESRRALKRHHVAIRDPKTDRFVSQTLDAMPMRLDEIKAIAEEATQWAPKLSFIDALSGPTLVTASAAPVSPAGTSTAPTPERPYTYFGWVMRADLDGFTARVEECLNRDQELQHLATNFCRLMDAAVDFVSRNRQVLIQLPWAGDNFTATAIFTTKEKYDDAARKQLVDLSLDFEKEMEVAAIECGFDGWAHGIAGGVVNGNSGGNVYLAGVEIDQERFLVGVGEGFGKSNQAFTDIDPHAKDMVVYTPDRNRLDDSYKFAFEPALKVPGGMSSNYHTGNAEGLTRVRSRLAAVGTVTPITFLGGQSRNVPTKHHSR